MTCLFCEPDSDRVFHEDEQILCLWDGFPVSDGHALVVPKRHFASWFEASRGEQASMLEGVAIARREIQQNRKPDGFNIGINVGQSAGQTIPHLHIHLIPRYAGDVEDPRGGVRHVIPSKGNYLAPLEGVRDAAVGRPAVFGSETNPFLTALSGDLEHANHIDLAVAFVTESGLLELEPFLVDLLERGGSMRILTGDYLGVTEPRAFRRLLDLMEEYPALVLVRAFQTTHRIGFHPKAYILERDRSAATAYIGSSNLTKHALLRGLEWNQRIEGGLLEAAITEVKAEFERLFSHPRTTPLSAAWIDDYSQRRSQVSPRTPAQAVDPEEERPPEAPTPHSIQAEALDALQQSRTLGNKAGLVVMATGLGKTWLAAFDSANFKRVLFVAHREEILNQALNTFRRIRPDANLGMYMGGRRDRNADVLFASIQTLGRQRHLDRFAANRFDYIVVDEFHHAAAKTYRRLIDYFDADFLLGLTATPERTDGGELLTLCGENVVFRCDLMDGIRRTLLSPFHYYGVPDEIDFANIPWRSGRFDPEKLEHAVASERRASNAFDQWKHKAQTRTLAFCVSKRHADFMVEFCRSRGARAVAVHSGSSSAPRTKSLKQLETGELEIVFAVDMFNEGVDVPAIDTVMMLRPTESRILWLQQFGRGLRRLEGKSHLSVIDYIGNHRAFLQVPMLLLPGAGTRPGEVSQALEALQRGELELPEGCSIEYELEALNILKQLSTPTVAASQITHWYRSFLELHGRRPFATEAYHEGFAPSLVRQSFGSWLGFVKAEGDLSKKELNVFTEHREFFEALETTKMVKSFKMVTLIAMMAEDSFPGPISIEVLGERVSRFAQRSQSLSEEFGGAIERSSEMRALLERNPINAWVGTQAMGGKSFFTYESNRFSSTLDIGSDQVEALRGLTREICDWRLAQYLDRLHGETSYSKMIVCNVSHSGGNPILFLPNRDTHPGIPTDWVPVHVDDDEYEAKFVKIAVNVVRRPGGDENVLPKLLRSFFGEGAGLPGNSQKVKFVMKRGKYDLAPVTAGAEGAVPWNEYLRAQIPPLWGAQFNTGKWNKGVVFENGHLFLLVSLDKKGMAAAHQYEDRFLSRDIFQWVSQNQTKRESPVGGRISNHEEQGRKVHLFVRDQRKTPRGTAAQFVYCGDVTFIDWAGDQPITVRWKLQEPLPNALASRFGLDS